MLIEITDDPQTSYLDAKGNTITQKETGEFVVRASFYDNGEETLYVKGFSPATSLEEVIATMRKMYDNNTNTNK